MKVGGILFIVLGVFVLTAGIVYGIWGLELSGTFYLCVLGVAFMYLAHVLLHAARDEPRETEDEYATVAGGEAGGHGTQALSREALEPVPVTAHASPPALTPFLFAMAGHVHRAGPRLHQVAGHRRRADHRDGGHRLAAGDGPEARLRPPRRARRR